MQETDLDATDRRILRHLQEHGRASNLELAEAVHLSPAQCHRRHRRLEEKAEKPVGSTWVGLAAPDGVWARHFVWDGDRRQNKQYSSDVALQMVIDYLEGKLK